MFNKIFALLAKKSQKAQKGATAVEYGLLAALIAVAIIVSVQFLGEELNTTFKNITGAMADANRTAPAAN